MCSWDYITGEVITDLPFSWTIPEHLLPRFNEEDIYNSIRHHYGVY